MTNHLHLAIQVGEKPLSRIMQNFSARYTRWVNWRHNRVGHFFQGCNKAVLIDADSYLVQLTAYLHLNPVRAGMAATCTEYEWSSRRSHKKSGQPLRRDNFPISMVLCPMSRIDPLFERGTEINEGNAVFKHMTTNYKKPFR